MEMSSIKSFLCCLLCLATQIPGNTAITAGTADGTERWGYVTVRPKANIFWWHYKSPQRVSSPGNPWPTILWLAGGPGVSGVGNGNFQQIGPFDVNLNPRNSTWLHKADLIFIDSPVGVGYSYVEDQSALAKTDLQAAMDVVELIKALTKEIPMLHSSPLYLVGESYGGKLAAMIGVSVARSIRAGSLNLTLGGVVLGDSWISPDDFALSYPLFLHTMSRLDENALLTAIRMGVTVKQQIAAEQFSAAYKTFVGLFNLTDYCSSQVNLQNVMIDSTGSDVISNLYKRSLTSGTEAIVSGPNTISDIMNGVIKEKLEIIPKDVMWQEVSLNVFDAMNNNFMRPAINKVDELLMYGLNVTVYNGQLDVICSTIGAESWLKKLRWDGLHNFLSLPRTTMYYCHPWDLASAFVRSYKNLTFYWVLRAGHMVPVDQPCTAVHMIGNIVQSPAS